MTRFFYTIFILLLHLSALAQQDRHSLIGYLDSDSRLDTLNYHYEFSPVDGPAYACELRRSNGKLFVFSLGVAIESMQMSSGKTGSIETYQWKRANDGFEETMTYKYDSKYDNWMLQEQVIIPANGKKQVHIPKTLTGIDGREYTAATR